MTPDWRDMFRRFAQAVANYDDIVARKCLDPDTGWAPDWTDQEREAITELMREGRPT